MKNTLRAAAIAAALLLALGGCTAPSEMPGQAPPTPTPSVTTESVAPASPTPTPSVTTESVAPASPTPTPSATPTPTPAEAPINNWVDLLRVHPKLTADLIETGWTVDQIAAQAAIRTTDGGVPNATVKVAFGSTSGGDLVSTGDCKVASPEGECPSEGILTGMLPIGSQLNGEPYRNYSKRLLVGFTADNNPFVLKDLTLEKR